MIIFFRISTGRIKFVHFAKILSDKGKPDQSRGRKATDPRFLREAMEDLPKDPKTAELPEQLFHSQSTVPGLLIEL
jgi:hypothetical protein